MARDLIPPPSPAGQPSPDAGRRQRDDLRDAPAGTHGEDLVLAVRPDDGEGPPPAAQDKAPRPDSPHKARFGLILGGLIGLGLAAVVLLAVTLAGDNSSTQTDTWSSWHPTSDDKYLAVKEIADHVGREYRLDDGSQLVSLEAGPIEINNVPLTVALREKTEKGDILRAGNTGVWYVFNGLGERGSISRGKASAARLALVKREALELALYTFRYVHGVDHVVTLLPPPPPAKATSSSTSAPADQSTSTTTTSPSTTPGAADTPIPAMLFRPEQLQQQLQLPLGLTLDPNTPTPNKIKDRDVQLITQFTAPNTFTASITQNQIGEALLVLDHPTNLPQLQSSITTVPAKKKAAKKKAQKSP